MMDDYVKLSENLKQKLIKYGKKPKYNTALQLIQKVSTELPDLKKEIVKEVETPKNMLIKKLLYNILILEHHQKKNISYQI